MIILSQDKKGIVNFDMMNIICVAEYGKRNFIEINYENAEHKLIAEYETEERAKEVLQEIWKFYEIAKRYECSSNNGITIFLEKRFTYEMPEK